MPSDTFKLIEAGRLPLPGTCCVCGSNQRACVDFGITVEYFGAVLICTECILDVARVDELGLMLKSEADGLLSENLRLTARDMEMDKVRKELRNALVAVADSVDKRIVDALPEPVVAAEVRESKSGNLF